ncbi:MAG: GGDEF domain-containing protein, partial [Pseudomonadota bacterium]
YGHAAGDQVIINVADMLVNVFGERGFCARIGGEEFAVLSCGMPFPEFAVLAELARSRMAGMRTQYDNDTISVTVSGGIAWARREQEFGETFSRADKALYTAKSSGRDRIVLSYQPVEQLEPGQTNSSVA